jgi:Glycogen recognition site of AMP-activated protein kinase/Alpha amylase, catalytic domain
LPVDHRLFCCFGSKRRDDISKFLAVKSFRTLLVIFLLGPVVAVVKSETPFLGPIPVQYGTTDKDVVLDMHRFFHQAGATLEIAPNEQVDIAFDAVSLQLRTRTKEVGLTDIELKAKSDKGTHQTILTLAVTPAKATQHFVFKVRAELTPTAGGAEPKTVALAGVFNGWSVDKTPLTGPNEKGEYAVDLPLEPGKYGYKFVVDGKWMLDPNNPETEDNGMGDKNSVVTVGGQKEIEAPVIYADSLTAKTLVVRAGSKTPLAKASAIFETISDSSPLVSKITGDRVDVFLPEGKAGFVRVIVASAAGAPSNVVRCAVGNAAKAFSWHDAVLYYAFTDRFADGDRSNDKPVDNPEVAWPANFHGGDLKGVRQKIEDGYFEKLGVNTIWVAPLNRNPSQAYQESPEPHRWYTG